MTARRYRLRVLRNLLTTGVLLLLLWREAGYPLPTLEMELHRWERQTLQEESEIIWTYDWGAQGDWDMLVGVSRNAVTVSRGRYSHFSLPRNGDRATLVPLSASTRYIYKDVSLFAPGLLAVDPPAGAERARLTIELSLDQPAYRETYESEGERQGDVFLFQVKAHHYFYWTGEPDLEEGEPGWEEREAALELEHAEDCALTSLQNACYRGDALEGYPWHLEFFDGTGNLLEEQFSDSFRGFQS